MWNDKIIEELQLTLKKKDLNVCKDENYIRATSNVINLIKESHTFYFGDIHELDTINLPLDETKDIFSQLPQYNKFPFKNCMFEVDGDCSEKIWKQKRSSKKQAILILSSNNYCLIYSLIHLNIPELNLENRWILEGSAILVKLNNNPYEEGELKPFKIEVRDDVKNMTLGTAVIFTLANLDEKAYKILEYKLPYDLLFVKKVLLLFHTKNISTQLVKPPEKVNKKRIKNGRMPKFDYYVLNVKLPGNRKQIIGQPKSNNSGSEELKPMTYWRGHFKLYTEDRPLFGKHVGLYWWDDHIRGNKNPVIKKDYNIEVINKEEEEKED